MGRIRKVLINRHNGTTVTVKANSPWALKEKINKVYESWNRQADLENKMKHLKGTEEYSRIREEQALQKTKYAKSVIEFGESLYNDYRENKNILSWNDLVQEKPYHDFVPPTRPEKIDFENEKTWTQIFSKLGLQIPTQKKIKNSLEAYEIAIENYRDRLERDKKAYETAKANYEADQKAFHRKILNLKSDFRRRNPKAVSEYCEMVTEHTDFPMELMTSLTIACHPDSRSLTANLEVPHPSQISRQIEYKYSKPADQNIITYMSVDRFTQFYNESVSQIIFRTLNELFDSSPVQLVDHIILHTWIHTQHEGKGVCVLTQDFKRAHLSQISKDRGNYLSQMSQICGHSFDFYLVRPVVPQLNYVERLKLQQAPTKKAA